MSKATSITNKLLAMKFFSEFILIYPLITIMFQTYGQVSAAGVGTILGLGLALSVVFQIPTGIIADKIPRKYVLFGSIVFKILALGLWLTVHNFTGYLVAATLFAFSDASESGTLEAYLYSALGKDSKKDFGKFWARVSAMVMISYTVAYLLTTLLGVHYPLLIGLSIVPCLVALIICASLPLDSVQSSAKTDKPQIFSTAVKHIKSSPALLQLIIGGVVIVALAKVMIEYLSLYYYQAGVSDRLVPVIMAMGNVLGAALFWSLHRWDTFLAKWRALILFVASGLFILTFSTGVMSAVIGAMFYTRFIRLLQVQYDSSVQHLANEQARATITSIGSFGSSLVGAVGMVLIGLFSHNNNVLTSIRVFLLVGAGAYILIQIMHARPRATEQAPKPLTSYDEFVNGVTEKPVA